MSVDGVKENISNKTPNRCTCHGVRRSRRLAKTNHDSCKCWKEKENRKEKDLTAGTMIPCDVKDTIEPLLETWGMELRPQKHRLTPLKVSLSCTQRSWVGTCLSYLDRGAFSHRLCANASFVM